MYCKDLNNATNHALVNAAYIIFDLIVLSLNINNVWVTLTTKTIALFAFNVSSSQFKGKQKLLRRARFWPMNIKGYFLTSNEEQAWDFQMIRLIPSCIPGKCMSKSHSCAFLWHPPFIHQTSVQNVAFVSCRNVQMSSIYWTRQHKWKHHPAVYLLVMYANLSHHFLS